jgi:hypothetical protein
VYCKPNEELVAARLGRPAAEHVTKMVRSKNGREYDRLTERAAGSSVNWSWV